MVGVHGMIFFRKIEKYNCEGMCSEKTCDKKDTHFSEIEVNGVKLLVSVCKKHAEEIEEGI